MTRNNVMAGSPGGGTLGRVCAVYRRAREPREPREPGDAGAWAPSSALVSSAAFIWAVGVVLSAPALAAPPPNGGRAAPALVSTHHEQELTDERKATFERMRALEAQTNGGQAREPDTRQASVTAPSSAGLVKPAVEKLTDARQATFERMRAFEAQANAQGHVSEPDTRQGSVAVPSVAGLDKPAAAELADGRKAAFERMRDFDAHTNAEGHAREPDARQGSVAVLSGAGLVKPTAAELTDGRKAAFERMRGLDQGLSGIRRATTTSQASADTGAAQLTAEQLSVVVVQGRKLLQRCYETALRATGSEQSVRLDVDIEVSPPGSVLSVRTNGKGLPGMDACVVRVVKMWHFPSSGDGTQTRFPVVFQPGG